MTPPTRANESSFAEADFGIKWFADGVLNVSVNCIDRHLDERGDQTAIIWEPDSPDASPRRYSYNDLHAQVCRFANVLSWPVPPLCPPLVSACVVVVNNLAKWGRLFHVWVRIEG